jgi:hypothetical protein
MNFEFISELLDRIIQAIQNSAIASVQTIRENLFKTKVVNFPKVQKVSGKVDVDQSKTENELKKLKRIVLGFKASFNKLKLPKSIEVSNFPDPIKPESFPKSFGVSNFPKGFKITNTKDLTTVRVKNQVDLKDVNQKLDELKEVLLKLKLDPKINVSPAKIPTIKVPEPKVTIKGEEFDYEQLSLIIGQALYSKDPKEYLSVRLSNGEKFYEAISELVSVSSSASSSPFVDANGDSRKALLDSEGKIVTAGETEKFETNDIVEDGFIRYMGYEKKSGEWQIARFDLTNPDWIEKRYATVVNNATYTSYSNAFTDREILNYDLRSES